MNIDFLPLSWVSLIDRYYTDLQKNGITSDFYVNQECQVILFVKEPTQKQKQHFKTFTWINISGERLHKNQNN